jgi:parvulin-like peptidyl-prolyl isomerase
LKAGQVSGPVQVTNGFAILALDGTQAPYIPKLDAVRDKVKEDVIKDKATALARTKAQELDAQLKAKPDDFDTLAKAAGFDAKTSDEVTRSMPLPDVGTSPALDQAAFTLPVGAVSDPVTTSTGVAIIHVVDRKVATADEVAKARDQFQAQLVADRRNQFFAAYMDKARQRMKILVNREALQKAIGS